MFCQPKALKALQDVSIEDPAKLTMSGADHSGQA